MSKRINDSPIEVECPECGGIQGDAGRGVRCEECGFAPMPYYDDDGKLQEK